VTAKDFMQGWALLVAQPYGAQYRKDTDAEQTLRRSWLEYFGDTDKAVWVQAVAWWIKEQDHFPLIPEMRAVLLRYRSAVAAPAQAPRLVHGTAIPVTQEAILGFAERRGITVFEAVRRWEEIAQEQGGGTA
jgi:hypothetical protein